MNMQLIMFTEWIPTVQQSGGNVSVAYANWIVQGALNSLFIWNKRNEVARWLTGNKSVEL